MVAWEEIQKALSPIHSFEDLSRHFVDGFSYAFVRECFNLSIPNLIAYTARLLGEDTRQRYGPYLEFLSRALRQTADAGVVDICELCERTRTREQFEAFSAQTGLAPKEVIGILKYLVYWFVPAKKSLRELVKKGQGFDTECEALRQAGLRCNLDLLAAGSSSLDRQQLANACHLPSERVTAMVHRADFSRLPWTSLATINNLICAGYPSLSSLAAASLEQATADLELYCQTVGKNSKHAIEIDNTHRIARLVPKVVAEI